MIGLSLMPAERKREKIPEALRINSLLLPEKSGRLPLAIKFSAENLIERAFKHNLQPERKSGIGNKFGPDGAPARRLDEFHLLIVVRRAKRTRR